MSGTCLSEKNVVINVTVLMLLSALFDYINNFSPIIFNGYFYGVS